METYSKLRSHIISGYVSVLHGISEGGEQNDDPQVVESVLSMYNYLKQLVLHSENLSLKGEIVQEIMDLYIDIVQLFCREDQPQRVYSYYSSP